MTLPQSHIDDAHKLIGDGIVELFEISLVPTGILRLKANNTVTWQSQTYEGVGIKLDEIQRSADDQSSRPKLLIGNPAAVYSSLVRDGQLDGATVVRKKVLKANIDSNTNVFESQTWRALVVPSLNRRTITLELRELADGAPFFMLPFRTFSPPDFPLVSLS